MGNKRTDQYVNLVKVRETPENRLFRKDTSLTWKLQDLRLFKSGS